MSLRLTHGQARDMGILPESAVAGDDGRTRKRRDGIRTSIRKVRESRCDVVISNDGKKALVQIKGVPAPSLNEVMRYDLRREFYSLNKAWIELVQAAAMVCRPRRLEIEPTEVVDIHLHTVRKRLLDVDNICKKSPIDAIRKAGIIPDDSPTYVGRVTESQLQGGGLRWWWFNYSSFRRFIWHGNRSRS